MPTSLPRRTYFEIAAKHGFLPSEQRYFGYYITKNVVFAEICSLLPKKLKKQLANTCRIAHNKVKITRCPQQNNSAKAVPQSFEKLYCRIATTQACVLSQNCIPKVSKATTKPTPQRTFGNKLAALRTIKLKYALQPQQNNFAKAVPQPF